MMVEFLQLEYSQAAQASLDRRSMGDEDRSGTSSFGMTRRRLDDWSGLSV